MELEQDTSQTLLTLSEFVNYFLKNDGVLDQTRYLDFWSSMRGASYISILIIKYIITLTGEEKHVTLVDVVKRLSSSTLSSLPGTKTIEIDTETNQVVQNIITTIYFVSLFYKVDLTFSPLKTAMTRISMFGNRLYQHTGNAEYMFLCELENAIQKRETLSYFLQYYSDLNIPSDLDYQNIPVRLLVVPIIEAHIRKHFDSKETSLAVFENLIDILNHPSISDKQALTSMHMIRMYLMFCPYPPVPLLQKIIDCLKPYILYPKVYSNIALNVMNLASIEIKTPGAGIRSKLIEEIPLLLPSGNFSSISSSGFDKRVILIFDNGIKSSKHMSELLKSYSPVQSTGSELQMSMLCSIFESCLFIKSDTLGLEYCDPGSIDTFYNEAMKILENCVSLSNSEAMQYRIKHLTELKESIASSITTVKHFKTIKKLALPPLDISMINGFFDITSSSSGDCTSFSRHHYPKRESYKILQDILKEYISKEDMMYDKPLVKLGIVGGDSTMHNFVSGVLLLKLSNPEYFEKLDIRFYYFPVTSSTLGSWISSEDSWYAKQVLLLTRSLMGIYPTTNQTTSTKSDSDIPPMLTNHQSRRGIQSLSMLVNNNQQKEELEQYLNSDDERMNPLVLLRSGIENYFREARYPVNINIWRCECFGDHSTITIPFFSRAQIGFKAHVEMFKKSNNLPSNLKESEVVSAKNFKYNPLSLSLKYIQMTPSSVARVTGVLDLKSVNSIEVASLPISTDKSNYMNPNPTRPWLELMVMEDVPTKSKKKGYREEPKCLHISQLEIVSTEKFDVLLDQVAYGPFSKIKITSTIQPDKEKMISIPVMTFYETENDL